MIAYKTLSDDFLEQPIIKKQKTKVNDKLVIVIVNKMDIIKFNMLLNLNQEYDYIMIINNRYNKVDCESSNITIYNRSETKRNKNKNNSIKYAKSKIKHDYDTIIII